MKLSIVTTLYKSERYIKEFYKRIKKAALEVTPDYEIIFVDDGSPDNSLGAVLDIQHEDKSVVIVELSRNFGHHKAMMTGLKVAKGDLVFLIDCDLEEEPEWIKLFYDRLQKDQCDVVYGVQKKRKGKWFERLSGGIYYFILRKFTDLNIKKNIIVTRLMKRSYVNSLIRHREREIFMAGLWEITGYKQTAISVDKKDKGESVYTMRHKLSMLINSITSFSDRPLIYIFNIGFLISFASLFYILYLLIREVFFTVTISGWLSLMVSLWFLSGLIILFIGITGIYISKIFIETKNRPYTIVKKIHYFRETKQRDAKI